LTNCFVAAAAAAADTASIQRISVPLKTLKLWSAKEAVKCNCACGKYCYEQLIGEDMPKK
jgi:hypothetical protein